MDESTDRADVKGEEEVEERRCAEIDSLASQQFNTTELLLHSSSYEMRSLSLWLHFSQALSVCLYMCVCTCVYQYMCDPLMSRSIIYNLVLKVHHSVSFFMSLCLLTVSLSPIFQSFLFLFFCVWKMNFKLFLKEKKSLKIVTPFYRLLKVSPRLGN